MFSRFNSILCCSEKFTAVCCIVGVLSWYYPAVTNCACDILGAYTRGASGLFSSMSGMGTYMSKIFFKAIRTISLLRVYRAMAVLSIAMLATHFIWTFTFFYEHWQSIVNVGALSSAHCAAYTSGFRSPTICAHIYLVSISKALLL